MKYLKTFEEYNSNTEKYLLYLEIIGAKKQFLENLGGRCEQF